MEIKDGLIQTPTFKEFVKDKKATTRKNLTIIKMSSEIKKVFPNVYCLPVPIMVLNGNDYMTYQIVNIGTHESRQAFKTRKEAFTNAYNNIKSEYPDIIK